MSRRFPIRLRLSVALSVAIAALVVAPAAWPHPQATVRLMITGTDYFDDVYRKVVIEPFLREYPGIGIEIYAVRNSRSALSVLRAQRVSPQFDAVMLDLGFAASAKEEGLLAQMEPTRVPNAAELYRFGRDLGFWALPVTYDTLSLVYSKAAFPTPPRSWRALWSAQARGKVTILAASVGNVGMLALTVVASHLVGIRDPVLTPGPGLEYLAQLAPNVWSWNPRPDQYWMVAQGDAHLSVGWNARARHHMRSLGEKIGTVTPDEGTLVQTGTLALVAGAKRPIEAQVFINYALGQAAQRALAEAMYFAPTNRLAPVSEYVRRQIPLLSPEVESKLIQFNWATMTSVSRAFIYDYWVSHIMGPDSP
ncbi:hypothetical protein BIZ92_26765 [Achromobacter xylosoxidans]|uniref:ABC transporter substrate-binding protein n=2 Tax=Alcaligenes xylosoxydans xylosoxydans TaxID=85698 RepID=A0A1R1JT49_ALCXX|nr:hypothetical protein BIZ92_26765 [Achromobacter xylosoxidans]